MQICGPGVNLDFGIIQEPILVCIDGKLLKQQRPSHWRSAPTIIITGHNKQLVMVDENMNSEVEQIY